MLVEQVINGVVLGSMYALIAQGYTLVFGVLDKLNFAHGEIFMLGGFICLASIALGASLPIAILVTAIVSGILGLVVEFVGFRKFHSPDALTLPGTLQTAMINIGGLKIVVLRLAIMVISLLLMLVLYLVVVKTGLGRRIRAVAESPTKAALFGINVTRVNQQVFFIASAMAGLAGLALAVRTGYASTDVGFTFGLKALAIMAIGGMGDLRGALIGGLLVGVLEALD